MLDGGRLTGRAKKTGVDEIEERYRESEESERAEKIEEAAFPDIGAETDGILLVASEDGVGIDIGDWDGRTNERGEDGRVRGRRDVCFIERERSGGGFRESRWTQLGDLAVEPGEVGLDGSALMEQFLKPVGHGAVV